MDAELKSWLLELATDVHSRKAKIGDINHDTLVAAYCQLTDSNPNYQYVRRILGLALGKHDGPRQTVSHP